jgi:alpha-galactosidase
MESLSFQSVAQGRTVFERDGEHVALRWLCGTECQRGGPDRAAGLSVLRTERGRFDGSSFRLVEVDSRAESLRLVWLAAADTFRVESRWSFCPVSGVIRRQDLLTNVSDDPQHLLRYFMRFPLAIPIPEVYSQHSTWIEENQGEWLQLTHGKFEIANERGRTTCAGTPYLGLRAAGAFQGVAFHILPCGNWLARVHAYSIQQSAPITIVELGIADEDLCLEIAPDEIFEAPEVLIHRLPDGEPDSGAPLLHTYLRTNVFSSAKQEPPMIYNTWFYQFDRLDVPSLREQLSAAKEIGCEVFVVDAGWFGVGGGWSGLVGDWREKTDQAFFGKMSSFAEAVRAAGLGFGLWMEPERFAPFAPILKEHPEWFFHAEHDLRRIDLENPLAYSWLHDEMSRLLDTYRLAWMKIDFNFELGLDPTGAELYRYYRRWYAMLDELRAAHPNTYIEGCASGGMRLDLNTLSHFDGHFLTDTVNPVDVLRITQGAWLRLPPGRLTRWLALRSAGNDIPRYSDPMQAHWPVTIITPSNAGWEPSESVDTSFAALAMAPGVPGLSGELARLPQKVRDELRQFAAFYKRWRNFISSSVGYLLTPPRHKTDRTGWAALQLMNPTLGVSLVFVYRLVDWRSHQVIHLQGLNPLVQYRVQREDWQDSEPLRLFSGETLMREGLEVYLTQNFRALVYSVAPVLPEPRG